MHACMHVRVSARVRAGENENVASPGFGGPSCVSCWQTVAPTCALSPTHTAGSQHER
jgi:hypothetical protein